MTRSYPNLSSPRHALHHLPAITAANAIPPPDYPDRLLVVTCTPVSGRSDVIPEPAIVVEVLSRSTQGFDRGAKLDAYQQIPSLKQYVLVAQEEIRVSVFERDDDDWRYRTVQSLDASLTIAVADATMGLAEIYEGATVAIQATPPGS